MFNVFTKNQDEVLATLKKHGIISEQREMLEGFRASKLNEKKYPTLTTEEKALGRKQLEEDLKRLFQPVLDKQKKQKAIMDIKDEFLRDLTEKIASDSENSSNNKQIRVKPVRPSIPESEMLFLTGLIHKFYSKDSIHLKDLEIIDRLEVKDLGILKRKLFDFTWNLYKSITFSKNIFVPLINLCRNECYYCGFRKEPSDPDAKLLNISEIKDLLNQAKEFNCKEVLLTFGEKPEEKYPEVLDKLNEIGDFNSLHEYHMHVCKMILDEGLLPHSNPGLLTFDELKDLKGVNASMGLMLESSSNKLCKNGSPHEKSPSKNPQKRLEMIENAGRLKIPFTTGILIGIGENFTERVESLLAIRDLHERYGHIQEIIIQNFHPKMETRMVNTRPLSINEIIKTIYCARLIFKDSLSIQVPPNLNVHHLDILLFSGINDLGGISPVTLDEINPEMKWPQIQKLEELCNNYGVTLKERLPVYPRFISSEFLSQKVLKNVQRLLNN